MSTSTQNTPLRILHCLRAPVGGLFRHVCDLTRAQHEAGHSVGIICADSPDDKATLSRLSDLEESCSLGVTRIKLGRLPGIGDFKALQATSRLVGTLRPDILHGHGAKGGLLARCALSDDPSARTYTPHGGTIHYTPLSPAGILFGAMERLMMPRTDGLIFESDFTRSVFANRFGRLPSNTQVVNNGLMPGEFDPLPSAAEPADFLFLGEIRELKGVFTLLEAVSHIARKQEIKVNIAGDGPDIGSFRAAASAMGLNGSFNLLGNTPARTALAGARAVVMPSHKDSFPYVALETAAAGKPLIATSTGGVPEIFGPLKDRLIEPKSVEQLSERMSEFLEDSTKFEDDAVALQQHVKTHFSVRRMAESVTDVYREAQKSDCEFSTPTKEFPPRIPVDAIE